MGAGLLAAREGQLVLHFLRDRIGISKMTYFPAVSQLLRTGARFNRYYWRHCVALAHGGIRALWSWLDANAHSEHSSNLNYKVSTVV
jgi:hypothetical protein